MRRRSTPIPRALTFTLLAGSLVGGGAGAVALGLSSASCLDSGPAIDCLGYSKEPDGAGETNSVPPIDDGSACPDGYTSIPS